MITHVASDVFKIFYVYELIDPRDGAVFYVGKGQGDRAQSHEKEAKKGSNSAKCRKIRDIIASGFTPEIAIVKRFCGEKEAFAFEIGRIRARGLENLTNVRPGGPEHFLRTADTDSHKMLSVLTIAQKTQQLTALYDPVAERYEPTAQNAFLIRMGEIFGDVITRRGLRWANKQVQKHNAKVERNRQSGMAHV